jgi:hypothetical protein
MAVPDAIFVAVIHLHRRAVLLPALMLWAAAAQANEHIKFAELTPTQLRAEADAYARASGLKPLRSSSKDELRLWAGWFKKPLWGAVITRAGVRQFVAELEFSMSETTVKTARPVPNSRLINPAPMLALLPRMQGLDGRYFECFLVDDGGAYLIDGVSDGRRVTWMVANPDSCSNDGSTLALQLEKLLHGISDQAP